MAKLSSTSATNRKPDYWYLDRKGMRTLLLMVVAVVGILSTACGTDNSLGLQDDSTVRGTSGLLLADSSLNSSKWYFDCAVVPVNPGKCDFVNSFDGTNFGLASSRVFDKVELYYSDCSKDGYSVNGNSFKCRVRPGKSLDGFMARLKSDGSKWFFDNGKWFIDVDSARWYGDCDSATLSLTSLK